MKITFKQLIKYALFVIILFAVWVSIDYLVGKPIGFKSIITFVAALLVSAIVVKKNQ
ncbi:hypothetical protein [Clostridium tunisiense]|uniref:hypothetical protein n=1 Tax=Clostridium tunisiense TaxID=219748 RepID=UPI0002FFC104|nr:hypothetical protein [Clostridium tunisiense]